MIIQRDTTTVISPRTREELLKRRNKNFYNASWQLRHPLGIYNMSLLNIWETFEEVLDELDLEMERQAFRNNPLDGKWQKTLLRRQEDLISRSMRHFDDCLSVLCCFYPTPQSKSREEDRRIIMAKQEIITAMKAIRPYRDHIANVMNHIKHYQGMLRGIVLFNNDLAIPGYYVEHVNQKGIVEPHPNVHQSFRGMHTAVSFNRELRLLFWIIFAVSEATADVIDQLSQHVDSIQANGNLEVQTISIAKRLEKLPKYLFNDEIHMDFPKVSVNESSNMTQLRLEYPSQSTILPSLSGRQNIATGWVEDGITKESKYEHPYNNV